MYPSQAPIPGLTTALAPSAAVAKGRWVDGDGNQMTVAGARARGVAYQNFSAADVANVAGAPPSRLTAILLGPARVELGATVGDKKFVTTDANGKTIEASTAGHEILGYIEKGGAAGDEREVFVLCIVDRARVSSAAINDLTATVGTASDAIADVGAAFNQATLNNNFRSLQAKVNAILAAQRAQKQIS